MGTATPNEARLFQSAPGMAGASNYADWTMSLFAPYIAGRVLEVGCGVGTFTRRLVADPRVERLLSIDVSEDAVALCRRTLHDRRLELRCADVCAVEGAFDLVVCMNVLEHIEDDRRALRHMLDLLAPGGTLFLLVPSHQWLYSAFDEASGHHRRYTKRHMRRLMRDAAPGAPIALRQFYFNSIGALGYWAVYKLLRKPPHADAGSEIGWFDRVVVPVQRRLEGRAMPFGISLVSIASKGETP